MKRRKFITLLGGAAAAPSFLWPLAARAQQGERVRRIGVLTNLAANDPEGQVRNTAFAQAQAQLGWTVGQNLRIEHRWAAADAERIGRYARELVARVGRFRGPDQLWSERHFCLSSGWRLRRKDP